jgi:hypothetical protein
MAGAADVGTVRPVACFPDLLTIVTEEASGEPLSRVLSRQATWLRSTETIDRLTTAAARIGGWVRSYQSLDQDRGRLSLADMRDYVDVRLLKLVRGRSGFGAADRRRALGYFDRVAGEVPEAELAAVRVHADLCPGNVLLHANGITVLDFSAAKRGAIYHDLAHMYMQIDLLRAKPFFRASVIQRLQRALLAGFDPGLDPACPMFRLMMLQHVACHFAGLVVRPAGTLSRVYNQLLQHRHRQWLRALQ